MHSPVSDIPRGISFRAFVGFTARSLPLSTLREAFTLRLTSCSALSHYSIILLS